MQTTYQKREENMIEQMIEAWAIGASAGTTVTYVIMTVIDIIKGRR